MKIRIAQFGLGPIRIETLKLAATKPWAEVVGAIDIDPAKFGRPLTEITGDTALRGASVHRFLDELVARTKRRPTRRKVSTSTRAILKIPFRTSVTRQSACEAIYPPLIPMYERLERVLVPGCRALCERVVGDLRTGTNHVTDS